MNEKNPLTYIDLFSGCGGLSLGLERANWKLEFAVEKSPMAGATFFHNLVKAIPVPSKDWFQEYSKLSIEEQLKQKLVVQPVSSLLQNDDVRSYISNLRVDLVAGGPPCQGFSMAGRRNRTDERNRLAWDFLDIVEIANPKFVVIENVLGMNRRFKLQADKDSAYEQVALELGRINGGYVVQRAMANAIHYGAAQSRPRLLLIACRQDVMADLGIKVEQIIWKSNFSNIVTSGVPDLAPEPNQAGSGVSVREALSDLIESKTSDYLKFLQDKETWSFLKNEQVSGLSNHSVRNHGNRAQRKFALMQLLQNHDLPSNLIKHSGVDEASLISRRETLDAIKANKVFPIHGGPSLGLVHFDDFMDLLEELKTKKQSQRIVSLDQSAPTVMTSPDDFVHPIEPRVFTVRELSRFQGFPDAFIFRSKETTGGLKRRSEVPQYSQVGNAVSPFLSFAIGKKLSSLIYSAKPKESIEEFVEG